MVEERNIQQILKNEPNLISKAKEYTYCLLLDLTKIFDKVD